MIDNHSDPQVIRYKGSKVKRYDLLNALIRKYKFTDYLEIGVFRGENIRQIICANKDGVDPGAEGYVIPEVNYPMTSDDFFKTIDSNKKYQLIFIDGLHHADQVDKDIENALRHLAEGGFILLHDCSPVGYEAQLIPRQTEAWTGDVWKSIVKLRCTRPDLDVCVVDTDFGIGCVRPGVQKVYDKAPLEKCLEWEYFDANRVDLLNLVSPEAFKRKYLRSIAWWPF